MEDKPYRFEFKYYLSNQMAHEIRRQVERHLSGDKHATASDGSYVVSSLYFDSYRYTDYWEKTGGNIKRKKIRLRIYEPYLKDSKFVNFEIKHKQDMTNRKTKIRLTREQATEFIKKGVSYFLENKNINWQGQRDRLLYYLIKESVKPRLLVTYKRRAFMSPDKNWRITFDSNIKAQRQNNLDKSSFLLSVHKNSTIMEVKYQYALQFWLQDIIRQYNLQRDTFSKYERSYEVLNAYNPLLR